MNGEKQKENNTSDFFAKLLLFLLFKLYSVTIVVIPAGRGLFSNQNEFLSFFGLGIVNAPAVMLIKLSVKEESDQRSGLNQKFSF